VVTCFWLILAKIEEDPEDLIRNSDLQDESDFYVYVTAFYYTITTITTVGYGDISPVTIVEKIFGICMMCLGVVAFSFATGSLS